MGVIRKVIVSTNKSSRVKKIPSKVTESQTGLTDSTYVFWDSQFTDTCRQGYGLGFVETVELFQWIGET